MAGQPLPPAPPPCAGEGGRPPSPAHGGGAGGRGCPAIYYVGQLYSWKGAGLVVEVAARIPEARIVIVGGQTNWTADDPNIAALGERARALGVHDRVELRG